MKDQVQISSITLGAAHALIVPHLKVDKILQEFVDKDFQEVQTDKYGLFGASTPNFHTWYPDSKPEDFEAGEDEFIYPIFRALSKTIVHRSWNPVDFTQGNVLKNSMPLLIGQTIYTNHQMEIGNEVGAIPDVAWQEGYTTKSGAKIPAGINTRFKIDGRSHTNLCRKIQMTPPAVHSTSVTVTFAWKKSHPNDEDWGRKLGSYDDNGQLYRRIATEIMRYSEISFVPHGADPFAKKIGADGKIVLPEDAARRDGQSFGEGYKDIILPASFLDYKQYSEETESFKEVNEKATILQKNNNNENNNSNTIDMNREFLISLAAILNIQFDGVEDDQLASDIKAEFKNVTASAKNAGDLQTQLTEAQDKIKLLEKDDSTAELSELKTFKADYMKKLSDRVVSLYNKVNGDKVDEAFVKTLENADQVLLETLEDQYTKQLDAQEPLTCQDCGSHSISRKSSSDEASATEENGDGGEDGGSDGKPKTVGMSEAMNSVTSTLKEEVRKSSGNAIWKEEE